MAIIGFNLQKISVERKKVIKDIKDKIDIKSHIDIKEVKKENLEIIKNQEVLSFDFTFDILYEPGMASLKFTGNVLLATDPKKAKMILKTWKDKQVPIEIKNFIFTKCSVKALYLEEEMALPFHLPFPRFAQAEKKE